MADLPECNTDPVMQKPPKPKYGINKLGKKYKYTGIPHLDTALSYVGVTDNGNNTGKDVRKFQKSTKSRGPWCAAFASFCLLAAKVSFPDYVTPMAQRFINDRSIKAIDVFKGYVTVPAGYLSIWKKGDTWKGHVGFTTEEWTGQKGKTIEGNTSPTNKGDQRNGEGVYPKEREIEPYNYFRITHFTPVEY